MTNPKDVRTLNAGQKRKPGYIMKPVPTNDNQIGASEKDLSKRWGREEEKVGAKGRVTRQSVQAQFIPGALEPVQEEREARDLNPDQMETSVIDQGMEDLDRPTLMGEDRSPKAQNQPTPVGVDGADLDSPAPAVENRSTDQEDDRSEKSDSNPSEVPENLDKRSLLYKTDSERPEEETDKESSRSEYSDRTW
jgi:hypothetical protein